MNITTDLIKTSSAISPEILEILLGWEKESDLEERNRLRRYQINAGNDFYKYNNLIKFLSESDAEDIKYVLQDK